MIVGDFIILYGGTTSPTGSALDVVSLAELKTHLRIDAVDADTEGDLLALLAAAVEFVEDETRQQLATKSLRHVRDSFPAGRELKLPRPPLRSVEAIAYTDPRGDMQTLDPGHYTVDTDARPGRVVLRPGRSWPATDGSANAVRVQYTAG